MTHRNVTDILFLENLSFEIYAEIDLNLFDSFDPSVYMPQSIEIVKLT